MSRSGHSPIGTECSSESCREVLEKGNFQICPQCKRLNHNNNIYYY